MQNDDTVLQEGGSTNNPTPTTSRFWAALQGEEQPSHMLCLLAVLVLLLHIWILALLNKQKENVTLAAPLSMQVSMVTIPMAKPTLAPAKPLPPPPAPPKLNKPKPVVKKPTPLVQKAPAPEKQEEPDFAPFEPFKPAPSQSANTSNTAAAANTGPTAESNSAQTFTEANFKANYDHNPKPEYPAIAKSRGWQGKVLLRVKVSAQGLSDAVTVEKSSGREILDDSAVEAVKKWRFIPAKRGDTPVASSVIVPIDFKLR